MKKKNFHSKLIDRYFLEKECPYTKRRPLRLKSLLWIGGGCLVLFMVLVFWFGAEPEQKSKTESLSSSNSLSSLPTQNSPGSVMKAENGLQASNSQSSFVSDSFFGSAPRRSVGLTGGGSRSHGANQVIRRGESGNDPLTRLPLGTTIEARLLNSILSTDTASPVLAMIPQDILAHGTSSIPAGTQAIGQATYSESMRRIQVRFTTLVYPDGDQHPFQGMAMMTDGSAGLVGDYHSEGGKRELGSFLGNFISGLATGMEDRTAAGQMGIPYELGSVKNGLLDGVSRSAQNEAKAFSEDLSKSKPFMTLDGGQRFVIFLEHEYLP